MEVDLDGTGDAGGRMGGKCDQNALYIIYVYMYDIFKHNRYIKIPLPSANCLRTEGTAPASGGWAEREAAATAQETDPP